VKEKVKEMVQSFNLFRGEHFQLSDFFGHFRKSFGSKLSFEIAPVSLGNATSGYDIFVRFISQSSDFSGQLVKKKHFHSRRAGRRIVKGDFAFACFLPLALTFFSDS